MDLPRFVAYHFRMADQPRLPLLHPFPPTLKLLGERLEVIGYKIEPPADDPTKAPSDAAPVGFAILPLAADMDLEKVTAACKAFRARAPEAYITGVYSGRMKHKVNELYRSGLNGYYAIPLEEEIFLNKVFEMAPLAFAGKEITYDQLMRVNVVELDPAKQLTFNVYLYLPMNRKIILYFEKNAALDPRSLQKFKENPNYNLYVHRSDIKAYLAYCSGILAEGKQVSEKLNGLMGGFFNDDSMSEDESRMMLENLKSLVGELEDQSGGKKDLVRAVSKLASQQMSHFSHAQNVAAYSCLFGMSLGINEPETLRMGGLMHDLGLSDLPNHLIGRDLVDLSEADQGKYKLHPGNGKLSLEERKIKVPAEVIDMILYHHETPDGTGYPYGKKAEEIPPVAKVCAFADEFDKLTSVRPGKRQLTPSEAMRRIAGLDGKPPVAIYDPVFHKPLVDQFLDPARAPKAVKAEATVIRGNVVSLEDLLKTPRFAKRAQPPVAELWQVSPELSGQLKEHWTERARTPIRK